MPPQPPAVHTPPVIIVGGRTDRVRLAMLSTATSPASPPCAGCALNEGCPHEIMCMDIPVTEVERHVGR